MHEEHLQGWHREYAPDNTNLMKVMDLVQTEFMEGGLEEGATCKTVVLIPKVTENFQEIGLVEVIWKSVIVIWIAVSGWPSPSTESSVGSNLEGGQLTTHSRPILFNS